jgi:primase-polymerase (primpol)-like protein
MFSGKPIITSAYIFSETGTAINESECGWITITNDISGWTDLMRLAYETDKSVLQSKGKSGFKYALKNYSRKEGLNKISQLFYKFKD